MGFFRPTTNAQPSYLNGWAPEHGAPLHDSVADVFGGWVPQLGHQGQGLLDITGRNDGAFSDATLPNWGIDNIGQGGNTLIWDSDVTDSGIDLGDITEFRFERLKAWTTVSSFVLTELTSDQRNIIRKREASNTRQMMIRASAANPSNIEVFKDTTQYFDSTATLNANEQYTIAVTNDGLASPTIALLVHDSIGRLLSKQTTANSVADESDLTEEVRLWGGETSDDFQGYGGPVYFYRRVLADAECALIARDNLAPVRLKRFVFGSQAAAVGNTLVMRAGISHKMGAGKRKRLWAT